MLFVISMNVFHVMYSMILLYGYKKKLFYMCLLYIHFIIEWVWQYLEILQGFNTHFQWGNTWYSNVKGHIVAIDMSDVVLFILKPCGITVFL